MSPRRISGDTATGATFDAPGGTNLTEVTIVLGANPVLQLNGAFDPGNLSPGEPSGIDVWGTPEITQTIGGSAVAPLDPAGVDIQ